MSEETSPAPVPESVPDFRSESEPAPGSGSTPTDDPSGPRGPFLSWPPPGLEPIQGRLTGTNALLFLGAIVLVLPLLVSIGTEQSFTSLGVFGSAGWIVAVTTVCGLVLLAEGFRRFFTILRTGNRTVQQGHGWLTILQVAADGPRDTGFLLQGARIYEGLTAAERELLLRRRLIADAAVLAAALWLLLGFVLGVFLAARGVLGPTGLWWFVLLPIGVLLLTAALDRLGAGLRTRTLRRRTREDVAHDLREQIGRWRSQSAAFEAPGVLGSGGPGRVTPVRIASAIISTVAVILLVPILTFTFMGTHMSLHFAQTLPRFRGVQEKAIEVEHLRPYRLEAEAGIEPEAAGTAFRNLNHVGSRVSYDFVQPPETDYPQAWLFGRNPTLRGVNAIDLISKPTAELTAEERDVLRREAGNPAHAEFSIMARAAEADFISTYFTLPLPDTLSWASFPIPRLHAFVDGAKAHVAKAAWELHAGRRTQAEQTLREVISAGFLLLDEHTTLIGNLIGVVVTGTGGEALEAYYRTVGRTIEADRLATAREEIERGLDMQSPTLGSGGHLSDLDSLADIVMDRKMLRGLRWEFIPWVTTSSSFTNLNRAVFGPGEGYDLWLEQVKAELVRYPGEQELYDLASLGWVLAPADLERQGLPEWLLGLTFGESSTPGSFAALIRSFK